MGSTMSVMQVALVEGSFPQGFTTTSIWDELDQALAPLVGKRVRLVAHHVPSDPPDPLRWGAGSCLWEPEGWCPFGHHEVPTRMWALLRQGYLIKHPTTYEYEMVGDAGEPVSLWLRESLVGHRAKVVCATIPEIGPGLASDKVRAQLDSLESVLSRIRGMT